MSDEKNKTNVSIYLFAKTTRKFGHITPSTLSSTEFIHRYATVRAEISAIKTS